ncbi:uncharacterized protein BDV17DRAFT_19092 [Aspergillus undulatus]|uniref:uncharacterized protein n=1 Tax=Aspergillus undulatus TaxID=1810928 RepID=UPI003CCD151F
MPWCGPAQRLQPNPYALRSSSNFSQCIFYAGSRVSETMSSPSNEGIKGNVISHIHTHRETLRPASTNWKSICQPATASIGRDNCWSNRCSRPIPTEYQDSLESTSPSPLDSVAKLEEQISSPHPPSRSGLVEPSSFRAARCTCNASRTQPRLLPDHLDCETDSRDATPRAAS